MVNEQRKDDKRQKTKQVMYSTGARISICAYAEEKECDPNVT